MVITALGGTLQWRVRVARILDVPSFDYCKSIRYIFFFSFAVLYRVLRSISNKLCHYNAHDALQESAPNITKLAVENSVDFNFLQLATIFIPSICVISRDNDLQSLPAILFVAGL